MARRWVEFSRDVLQPAYPWWSDWIRVTGVTKSEIAHAHVVFFGGYLPHDWLVINWGRFSGGDDAVWVDEVKGLTGSGVSRYLGRQFVEYLSGQGVRARWSCSSGWRAPRRPEAGGAFARTARPSPGARERALRAAETSRAALEFVQGEWYRGHDGPLPVLARDGSGRLHSQLSIVELFRALA